MNIPEIGEKIKSHRLFVPILQFLIFTLISLASFGLGRISVLNQGGVGDGGVTIITPEGSQVTNTVSSTPSSSRVKETVQPTHEATAVFASKTGTTYYFESCGESSRIKEENKVWFTTEQLAQNAGYHLAKACE